LVSAIHQFQKIAEVKKPVSTDLRFWMQGFWILRNAGGQGTEWKDSGQNQPAKVLNRQFICTTPFDFGGKL
jgi:hypothetical protein